MGGIMSLLLATSIHGLIVYLVGMILIGGALVWANHSDHERHKRRASKRQATAAVTGEKRTPVRVAARPGNPQFSATLPLGDNEPCLASGDLGSV
jgi:hypothetical protein